MKAGTYTGDNSTVHTFQAHKAIERIDTTGDEMKHSLQSKPWLTHPFALCQPRIEPKYDIKNLTIKHIASCYK